MKPTGAQIAQLLDALLDAYPRRDDLRLMVRVELDENLDAVAGGDSLRAVAFSLIEWAIHRGRIEELVAGAHRSNPGNKALRAAAAALGVALEPPPVQPAASSSVAALLLREKTAHLNLLMTQYAAASQQLRTELNAANRPPLEERLRQLEAEMRELQAEIDGINVLATGTDR